MKEKILKIFLYIGIFLLGITFILSIISMLNLPLPEEKMQVIYASSYFLSLVIMFFTTYIANKTKTEIISKQANVDIILILILMSILSVISINLFMGKLDILSNITALLFNNYTICIVFFTCYYINTEKQEKEKKENKKPKPLSEKEKITKKASKKKWIILSIVGFLPIILITIDSIITMFKGSTFLGESRYGIAAFKELFLMEFILFMPLIIIGLIISIISLYKIQSIQKALK